jgi:hypothetical protein
MAVFDHLVCMEERLIVVFFFDTFCLPLKKIQKVQNTTFCLHFVETKDKQKAHICERQKKTTFSLSSMHTR